MRIKGRWVGTSELLEMLSDQEFRWLVEDCGAHLSTDAFELAVGVCPGPFCRDYRDYRRAKGLGPDRQHESYADGALFLIWEAHRRGIMLDEAILRFQEELGPMPAAELDQIVDEVRRFTTPPAGVRPGM